MSNKIIDSFNSGIFDPTPSPYVAPRDIRDLFSYRLAYMVRLNDRQAQTVLVEKYGLTLGEWRTMATIRYLGRPSLRILARTTQQDEGLLSRYVAGLLKRGLVQKSPSSLDQRALEISLTETGETRYHEVMDFAWRLNQDLFADMTSAEQEQLLSLLDKIFQSLLKY